MWIIKREIYNELNNLNTTIQTKVKYNIVSTTFYKIIKLHGIKLTISLLKNKLCGWNKDKLEKTRKFLYIEEKYVESEIKKNFIKELLNN